MMSTRKVVPGASRRRGASDPAGDWTDATEVVAEAAEPEEARKKLSLDIPASTHQAEKIGAATRGNTMLAEVIEMLRARNGLQAWPADVVESVKAQIAEQQAEAAPAAAPRAARKRREA